MHFTFVLTGPLLELMSSKAMKFRHWERIQGITKHTFDLESKELALSHILEVTAELSHHRSRFS